MLDFLAVGDVMLDIHAPAAGDAQRRHADVTVAAGGSAVNAALAAVALGARAGLVGCVGDDVAGRVVAAELARHGVAATLETVGGRTGAAVYSGTSVVADRGANARFPEGIALPEARVTLVSGYLDSVVVAEVLGRAPGLRAVDLQRAAAAPRAADVVLGPRLELEALRARHRVVCATLGRDGAVAVRGESRAAARPPRLLEEPAVGAGDRFAAGFLLALAAGDTLEACLARGCEAATR